MRRIAEGVRNYIRAAALSNGGAGVTIAQQVAVILAKYGTDAHVYLPGIGVINGLTAGNYLDSAGTTAATVDNPVGLVVDSGGINAIQATTANKPILRRGAVNLLTYSEQFDNAAWTKDAGAITNNAINDPDGNLTGDFYKPDATNVGTHRVRQIITINLAGTHNLVFRVKYGGYDWIKLRASAQYINFNLLTGVFGNSTGVTNPVATQLSDGWWEVSADFAITVVGIFAYIYASTTDDLNADTTAFAGDGTKGVYVCRSQLTSGSGLKTYIPTSTAATSSATGNYHWVHDSTDVLTATFPAGYESATIIDTPKSGQVTLTAQNIVGAYNVGPSIDTYGRFIFKTITASELAIVQSYCNRLAGV